MDSESSNPPGGGSAGADVPAGDDSVAATAGSDAPPGGAGGADQPDMDFYLFAETESDSETEGGNNEAGEAAAGTV